MNYGHDEATPVSFDYAASSVGLDFGGTAPVRRMYFAKDDPQADTSRVKPSTLDLYAATGNNTDGQDFEKLDPSSYLVQQTLDGYTFTFPNPVYASEFKVHSKFDERNEDNTFADKATFKSTLDEILRAEEEVSQATLEYGYDAVGNRTYERFTKATVHAKTYTYYSGSNRLLSDGKYAFVYDADGNLIRKGNRFTIQGEDVTFTTSGRGVEYWEYGYNLRNQLTRVMKNGQLVATYSYDGLGLRVTATTTISSQVTGESKTTTRDYVFDLMDRVIYDQVISTAGNLPPNEDPETSATNSYVFANGTHFAKVEGAIGSGAEVYFYHNDHLGSPMAITDSQGNFAWSQDYLPFGGALNESATATKTRFTFTGKELDPATGLYYYNARWYDADLGRFVTEDTYAGAPNEPLTLNRSLYVTANPLRFIDPTGYHRILVLSDSNPRENNYSAFVFDDRGNVVYEFNVGRNATGSGAQRYETAPNYGTNREAPPGTYNLGRAVDATGDDVALGEGKSFFTISDDPGGNTVKTGDVTRISLGLHAGREGYTDPNNPGAEFYQTYGCLRTDQDTITTLRDEVLTNHNFKGDVSITITDRFNQGKAAGQLIDFFNDYSQYVDDSSPWGEIETDLMPSDLGDYVDDTIPDDGYDYDSDWSESGWDDGSDLDYLW